jgi:hypothetical protein
MIFGKVIDMCLICPTLSFSSQTSGVRNCTQAGVNIAEILREIQWFKFM